MFLSASSLLSPVIIASIIRKNLIMETKKSRRKNQSISIARRWSGELRSMKFSKSLGVVIEETLPDWRDKFLSYKDLKKQLKLIYPKDGDKPRNKRQRLDQSGDADSDEVVTKEVIDFVRLLEDEMEKFNSFICEKEEDSVIKWKELQERMTEAKDGNGDLMRVGGEIVDFHGEMVLLENYSALNYTGLAKILKKYDKRSGDLVRIPFIQKVMQQPFFSTHVLSKLVKECEAMLESIFAINENEPSVPSEAKNENGGCDSKASAEETTLKAPDELAEIEFMESVYAKQTLSALRVLKQIRSGSSAVNMFSLPPLQNNVVEEEWKKVPVLEQTAK